MGRSSGRWTAALTATLLLSAPAAAHAARATGAPAELDTALAALVRADARGQSVAAAADARELTVTPGERVLVEVYSTASADTTGDRLDAAGADVLATAPGPSRLSVANAWVRVDALEALAAVRSVRAVLPVQGAGTDAGSVLSEGDGAHNGPAARALGVTGAGVKVGIISDSIDQVGGRVAASQASGDLPASVNVITDDTVFPSDEGRAMAEIVYDTAPGITQMAFASGTASGAAGKASAIDALVADGARIIADDIFYLSEPFFQDGQVAQAADRARAAGVLYFASAGNRARQSHESAPRFPAGTNVLHDFDAGAPTDTTQTLVTVPDGRFAQVALQWDEAWGAAKSDIDLELVRASDGALLASAATDNVATTVPSEIATWTNDTGAPVAVGVRIRFFGAAGGAPAVTRLKYIARGNFGTFSIAEHDTASDTINPDAAAATGSLAVAAVRWDDAGLNTPEPFSSRGPKIRIFDQNGNRFDAPEVRQKPELASADGVNTSVTGFQPFFGTSAAAPSAAGVAALVLSAKPTLPFSLFRAIMIDPRNAGDCTASGLPDLDCGWGFVFADRAVAQARDATLPSVAAVVSPAAGANGWARGDVGVTGWTVSDAESPSEQLTCPTRALTTDGETTVTCTARSAGGTTTAGAVLRRDATPPAVPAIGGIAATTYTAGRVPPTSALTCSSSDATSGLAGCVVTGHGATAGTHTLTATASDVAGNIRTATLTYAVAAPAPALVAATVRLKAADVVRAPSAKACVPRSKRLKLRVLRPSGTAIRTVRVRVTGIKRTITARRPGTITLPKLTRRRATVTVTVTLTDGRRAALKRTYRRC